MNRIEEIRAEIIEWDKELSDAMDDMASLSLCIESAAMMHEFDEEEHLWTECQLEEIDERIDAAQFWIDELEAEIAELMAA